LVFRTSTSIDLKLNLPKLILNCDPIKGGFFHKVKLLKSRLESIECEIELSFKSLPFQFVLQTMVMVMAPILGTSLWRKRKLLNKRGTGWNYP